MPNLFDFKISISYRAFLVLASLYVVIPVFLFFFGWLKLGLAIFFSFFCALCSFYFVKDSLAEDQETRLSVLQLAFIIFSVFIYGWLAGWGGYFYQTWDNHYRNAIFNDLVNHSWPVQYATTGSYLVYYICQWLVPAVLGKIFGLEFGKFCILLWNSIGIVLVELGILFYLKKISWSVIVLIVVLMFSWSGMHMIGMLFSHTILPMPFAKGDTWIVGPPLHYTSNFLLLQWVYNQVIVPWLLVVLLANRPDTRFYGFYAFACLPFAPLPFIGFFFILFPIYFLTLIDDVGKKQFKSILKKTFSLTNIFSFLGFFVIFCFYLISNDVGQGPYKGIGLRLAFSLNEFFSNKIWLKYILFCFVEFLVYTIIMFSFHKKNRLFVTTLVCLFLCPFFKLGVAGRDFCMRVSIPALFLLLLFCMQFLLESKKELNKILLIICLTFGSYSFLTANSESFRIIRANHKIALEANEISSLEDYAKGKMTKKLKRFPNWVFTYLCSNPKESIFFRYFARVSR